MTTEELIRTYIEQDPFSPGLEEARLIKYGVPIWALVGHWRAVGQDQTQVASDYDIPAEAVEAALAFYERHKPAVDARIAANAA